ncbi:MAG: DUF2752 domain-containing protein [Eubacterium sp.]|nr:DUF2752 domain-containing protein [Eubacterium sp.]
MIEELKKTVKEFAVPVAIIAALYAFFWFVGIGCPIKYVTGVSCLGCGMTRAWLAVLRLDFSAAFYYHPLFWLVPIGVVWFVYRRRIPKKVYNAGVFTFCALFVIVYVVRLFHSDGQVVSIHLEENIYSKIFRFLKGE